MATLDQSTEGTHDATVITIRMDTWIMCISNDVHTLRTRTVYFLIVLHVFGQGLIAFVMDGMSEFEF